MKNTKLIEEILHFDPMNEAEKMTSDPEEAMKIGFFLNMKIGQLKRNLLDGFDTHFMMQFTDAQKIITEMGFISVYEKGYEIETEEGKKLEKYVIYKHPTYTIFISLEEYRTRVNTCRVYANVKTERKKGKYTKEFMEAVSYMTREALEHRNMFGFFRKAKTICVELDGREALRIRLAKLQPYLTNKPFKRDTFIWFVHYTEKYDKEKNLDLIRTILQDKIWNEKLIEFERWFFSEISSKIWGWRWKTARYFKMKWREIFK